MVICLNLITQQRGLFSRKERKYGGLVSGLSRARKRILPFYSEEAESIQAFNAPSHRSSNVTSTNNEGAAVAEWLSSWLAEQEDRGSIPSLAT